MELFRLLGTVAIDTSEAKAAVDEVTEKAESSQGKIGAAFSKIGSAAVKVGKTIAAGIAVGSAAVAGLAKSALDGYADYEQLVGGVETLFGAGGQSIEEYAKSVGKTVSEVKDEYDSLMTAQETVLKNADAAYQTAGMSANEYMETVTSFSASLIQSLDGDTEAAAAKANQAIVDMSDNANKMGSDIASIQNAYQGFAKQNYTMLDNLKLGYGGTKEEMARLLRDAEAISGIKYDISSYADVVDAIHVIQEEMGIAGTTAKEASATISGSVSAAKSAWQNLVAGLGNEDADIGGLIDKFFDSVFTAADNIIPRLEVILKKIVEAIPKVVPKLTSKLVPIIKSLLPALIEGAVSLINSLVEALPDILGALTQVVPFLLEGIVQVFDAIVQSLPQLISMICDALPDLIPALIEAAGQMVASLVKALPDIIVSLIEALPDILKSIGEGLVAAGGAIIDAFGSIFSSAKEFIGGKLDEIGSKIEEHGGGIKGFLGMVGEGTKEAWGKAFNAMDEITGGKLTAMKSKIEEHGGGIKGFFGMVGEKSKESWSLAFNKMDEITGGKMSAMKQKIEENGGGIKGYIKTMTDSAKQVWDKAFSKMDEITGGKLTEIKDKMSEKLSAAKDTVVGIFEKIKTGIKDKLDMAKDTVSGIIEKIKGFFDFDFKLPKIKMPHFSITPSGWKIGDLLDGKIPKLGIEWYAKGGVMEKPTIFGVNGNNAMVGGEAGAEAIAPISTLKSYIREAVAEQNAANYGIIREAFADALREVLPDMQEIVKVEADENGIFRVVRDKAKEHFDKTGNLAFA